MFFLLTFYRPSLGTPRTERSKHSRAQPHDSLPRIWLETQDCDIADIALLGVYPSGQNPGSQAKPLGKHHLNRARCGKRDTKKGTQRTKPQMDTSGAKVNQVWRRKGPFGTGKVNLEPERNQKAPTTKLTSVSPSFRKGNRAFRSQMSPLNGQ